LSYDHHVVEQCARSDPIRHQRFDGAIRTASAGATRPA